MNERFIAPSKEKLTKNLRRNIGIFALAIGINWVIYEYFNAIHVVLWMLNCLLFLMIPYSLWELYRPAENRGLLLTSRGLTFRQSILGRVVGEIRREDIDEFVIGKFEGEETIFLIFKDPELYIKGLKVGFLNARLVNKTAISKTLRKDGVPLRTDELDTTVEDLHNWLSSYLKQHGEKRSE